MAVLQAKTGVSWKQGIVKDMKRKRGFSLEIGLILESETEIEILQEMQLLVMAK